MDAEDEPDRHSGVHALILVIMHPNSTFEEEEDEMVLNRGNKGLRELMTIRNKVSTLKEAPKSQVPATLPPHPLLPLTDLGLHTIPNLKKKRPVQELKEGEVALQKGTKQQKVAKNLRDKRSTSVDSREEQTLAKVRLQQRTWSPRLEVDGAAIPLKCLCQGVPKSSFCIYS